VRYDKLANAPQVGDAVAIYGAAGQYNGAAQMKNATLVCWEQKPATDDGEGGEGTEEGGSTEGGTAYNPVVGNTANIVIADLADASKWEDSKLYDSIVIDGYVTITTSGTATGSYGLNTGKYYVNGENWRIYQAEKPSVVITAAEGKKIATVKISYASQKTGVLTLDGANVESDQVVTVNGTTVTFSVGNTGTATNGQARITAIEIIFAEE
ncbi:MAG: hypothetical protein IJY69_05325, partial [Clostridia bacterium]|nr:hypothetical protein [Clostridia bacterium]